MVPFVLYTTFAYLFILLTIPVLSFSPAQNLAIARYPPRSTCPVACSVSGLNPSNWTYIHDTHSLRLCNATSLFDTNIFNLVEGSKARINLRACAAAALGVNNATSPSLTNDIFSQNSCGATSRIVKNNRDVQILQWNGVASEDSSANTLSATIELSRLLQEGDNCDQSIFLAQSKSVIVGVYTGPAIQRASAVKILQKFAKFAGSASVKPPQLAAQVCGSGNDATQTLGIFADATGNLSAVLSALQIWNRAQCLRDGDDLQLWENTPINVLGSDATFKAANATMASVSKRKHRARDTCSYTQAIANDGCWSLAQRCGITQAELEQYNPASDFCNDITVGEYVCCSAGSLPDFSPQPNSDGSCAEYSIQTNDTCIAIATAHSMTTTQLESRNSDVWGWSGCQYLYIGQVLCLSTGTLPMPAPIANAVCGPQVPNTTAPADMSDLAGLNPCPLNACCDIWGQCGITSDFCTNDPADTGAPGTAQPGSNGCISNCGTEIVSDGSSPSGFIRVGFYEAWNFQRPCLHMSVDNIDTSSYTHVHFAFGGITYDFQIDMSAVQGPFQQFRIMTGAKRIVSFGGWAFSTQQSTFNILRTAVNSANRVQFANTVAQFVINNNLDGVDFDWEYPGAPDIPGIPPGSKEDGPNYLAFLQQLRAVLPAGKTISIAAPASYWYLKAFPISEISETVDYIVFMTYDLHGQWDYNNAFSDPGCPGGNCLRSQVNKTETIQSLAMVTKAGVPSSKVLVGMALYGRSFQMTEPGCYSSDCTYTGPISGAEPGRCTDTAGYLSNYEIEQIIAGGGVEQYSSSDGDILVYDQTQWVSWMSPSTYSDRVAWVEGLNFGGTSDWAMDLNQTFSDADNSNIVYISPDIWSEADPTVACYPPCSFVFPPWSLASPTTISQPPVIMTVEDTWPLTALVNGEIVTTGYGTETTVTTISMPPVTTDLIQVWNYEWTDTVVEVIYITSSVVFPPILLTEDSSPTQTSTTGNLTVVPFLYTYSPDPFPPYTGPSQTPGQSSSPASSILPPPPPPGSRASVHVTQGPPSPTPKPGNPPQTGRLCSVNCIPEPSCLFCGCIGPGCPGGGRCIGSGCSAGGGSNGGGDESISCSTTQTASICTELISSYSSSGMASSSTITQTACGTTTGCDVQDSTTTTTITTSCPACTLEPPAPDWAAMTTVTDSVTWTIPEGDVTITGGAAPSTTSFVSCDYYGQDPDQGVDSAYCVCSGSTFAPLTNTVASPPNSCAYTALPTNTVVVTTMTEITTNTAICSACTAVGQTETCTSIPNCTPVPTTTTVTSASKTSATCQITGWADISEVVGGGSEDQEAVYDQKYGFIVGYQDGPTLGGMSGNSVLLGWQTLDGPSFGLANDIQWKPDFMLAFQGCAAIYEGTEYDNGDASGSPMYPGDTYSQCVINFTCEPNLTPVTSNNEGPT